MSDIMKQIVQEVLQGNKTKPIVTARATNKAQETMTDQSLKNIKRPNYQQMKKEERLSFVNRKATTTSGNERTSSQTRAALPANQFSDDSLSQLHSLSLAQGNIPKKSNPSVQKNMKQAKLSSIIGHTKNGGCVWFFPNLPKELIGSFQRPLDRVAVGVVRMPTCLPSYLLLINEIIRNNQDIKFHLSWKKDDDAPFTAELYDEDVERLEKIMKSIFQKINRRSIKPYETYTAVSPSPWLSKQLNINATVDAIAFLEGVPYYTSIVLMDALFRNFEKSDFSYEITSNYLLLKGNYHVISKLSAELKKDVNRL